MDERRQQVRTDDSADSTASITDSLLALPVDSWNPGISLLSNTEMQKSKPEHVLGRMLSTRTAISTDYSLAEINLRAQDDRSSSTFSSIGAGQCGIIYALKGTTMVIKLPKSPEKHEELFVDAMCHKTVREAFEGVSVGYRAHIHVPTFKVWVGPESEHFWATHKAKFSKDVQVPDFGLVSERIYPLPLPVRSALVDVFAPKAVRERKHEFLALQKNKDCLIRLYLGRRNDNAPPVASDKFHLRNFPLHINEMERLKLNTTYFTELMAQALAILHWRARLDANDVEFVFGSSPQIASAPTSKDIAQGDKVAATKLFRCDFHHRTVSVWLLDFNQCKPFNKDQNGLKQLVDAFYWNDPYYPRPTSTNPIDKDLWMAFAKHYLAVSAEFTDSPMPQAFIASVEERAKKRSGNSLFG